MLRRYGHMDDLNVPLADEKTEGPNKIMVFLDIELDTDKTLVRIPIEKITVVITKVKEMLNKKKSVFTRNTVSHTVLKLLPPRYGHKYLV
jgi:hypothetical protein